MQRALHSILVVDDDTSVRYSTARALRAAGYMTMEAASGAEALEFAEYVSAVILDIHLPDVLGWEVARLLRARASTAKLPVVHLTGRQLSEADRQQSEASGADAYLVAPVDTATLVKLVDELIGQREAAA